jgi:hypothetical protein
MKKILQAVSAIFMIVITLLLSPWLGEPSNGGDWEN